MSWFLHLLLVLILFLTFKSSYRKKRTSGFILVNFSHFASTIQLLSSQTIKKSKLPFFMPAIEDPDLFSFKYTCFYSMLSERIGG